MSTMISLQTILWSALAAAAGIGLPVLVLFVWKFKFCRGAKLFPAVVGAVTFVVFAQVLEGVPKAIFFGGGTGVSQYVLTHAWAYTLIGCLLAGVFEEVGRYLAFRFLLKRYTNRRDAVTYGIGHGGIEAILVLGLTAINNIAIAQLVNSGSIETITNGLTDVQLDQVQAQIAAVASFGAVLFHDVHSVHNALEHAFAAAAVGGIIQALNGQEESHVADFLDFLAESIVDQSTIGEQVEHGALVLGSQLEQIVLAAHRLAAGAHIPVDAQLFTLGNQLVHFLIGQVQAVAVLGSPAALAR